MSLWMVRAGRYGEQENTVIENNIIAIWSSPDNLDTQLRQLS